MRLARGQQLILRCGGTDAARQDTPPEPVKECEAGHSRDPSNIRRLFAWRRARRVRARLPPPPSSPADARTSGALGRGAEFFRGFERFQRSRATCRVGETRPGAAWGPVIVSRARFGGPGVREPCTTDPVSVGSAGRVAAVEVLVPTAGNRVTRGISTSSSSRSTAASNISGGRWTRTAMSSIYWSSRGGIGARRGGSSGSC